MKVESKLTFNDGKTADVTLHLTRRTIKLNTVTEGVTHRQVWDRNHVVKLDAVVARPGQIFPTLLLCSGERVNLGIILDQDQAQRLIDAF